MDINEDINEDILRGYEPPKGYAEKPRSYVYIVVDHYTYFRDVVEAVFAAKDEAEDHIRDLHERDAELEDNGHMYTIVMKEVHEVKILFTLRGLGVVVILRNFTFMALLHSAVDGRPVIGWYKTYGGTRIFRPFGGRR